MLKQRVRLNFLKIRFNREKPVPALDESFEKIAAKEIELNYETVSVYLIFGANRKKKVLTNRGSHFNVIVIGVGSMGSAACYYLAKRGHSVLGIEQFDTPHQRGSHAGQSRIIRKAYFEHSDYVPLLERAYGNWKAFERETGSQFYYGTGIVYFGKPENENIQGIRKAAVLHNIHIENLHREEVAKKFPLFEVPENFDTIFEPDAGFVTPERAIEAYVRESEKLGALIVRKSPVTRWTLEGDKIRVSAMPGDYTADKLVITTGAWASRLLPQIAVPLNVTRQLLAWVAPRDTRAFSLENFPCWFVEDPDLGTFYGFPSLPHGPVGLKLAHHHPGVPSEADAIDDPIPKSEEAKLQHFLEKYLPSAGDHIVHTKHCLYTYSPDSHFIIDHLPGYDKKVSIACGFSGHGFKFVPVVGEVLADLAMHGRTDLPVGFLGLRRLLT